jgi:stress response protein YsnF
MSYEKVVAVYDTEENANAAVKSLRSAGYLTDDISVIRSEGEAAKAGLYEPGVWQRLFGRDLEHHEAAALGRSFQEGSVIVSVRVPESEADRVMSLLDSHKPVDVLDRAKAYGLAGTTAETPKMPAPARLPGEETLRVAEEQINVGKRLVQAGLTRVRRYVIERPVEANVTLHEEHAEIMRRVISDPNYGKDIDWSDKTIEVTETVEEPVIGKTAHITEEVVIRRQGSDRTQTVHDMVRRQQVEVDHLPVGAGSKKSA